MARRADTDRMGRERNSATTTYNKEGLPNPALPAVGGAARLLRLRLAKQRAAPCLLRPGHDSHSN